MARGDGFVVLGNQLFPVELLEEHRGARFLMVEDEGFCHYARHHKQRLTMILAAMRAYRDELLAAGFAVDYRQLADQPPAAPQQARTFEPIVERWLERHGIERLTLWEVSGKALSARLRDMADARGLELRWLPSPMFLCERKLLDAWF